MKMCQLWAEVNIKTDLDSLGLHAMETCRTDCDQVSIMSTVLVVDDDVEVEEEVVEVDDTVVLVLKLTLLENKLRADLFKKPSMAGLQTLTAAIKSWGKHKGQN